MPHVIGYIGSGSDPGPAGSFFTRRFEKGLTRYGYPNDGTKLQVVYKYADGDLTQFQNLAQQLIAADVEAIVLADTRAIAPTIAARQGRQEPPIVMAVSWDPVTAKTAASWSNPGNNLTGLAIYTIGLVERQVRLLKEAVPTISSLAILYSPYTNDVMDTMVGSARSEANKLGLAAHAVPVNGETPPQITASINNAFNLIFNTHQSGALLVLPSAPINLHQGEILDKAQQLPAMYPDRSFATAAPFPGLLSYGPHRAALFERAAYYVARILEALDAGSPLNAGTLAIEGPSKFEFVVNISAAAQRLGITVPQSIQDEATEVI